MNNLQALFDINRYNTCLTFIGDRIIIFSFQIPVENVKISPSESFEFGVDSLGHEARRV